MLISLGNDHFKVVNETSVTPKQLSARFLLLHTLGALVIITAINRVRSQRRYYESRSDRGSINSFPGWYTWMRIPFLLLRGCHLLHQVARSGDFAKEAAHYHNTDRAFDLPLLSENFKGMEMKFMRVEFLSTAAWAPRPPSSRPAR